MKNKYKKAVQREIMKYDLEKKEKILITEQLNDVLEELTDEEIEKLEIPQQFFLELLEMNDIQAKTKRKEKNFVLWIFGLALISIGISMLFRLQIMTVILIPLLLFITIKLILKKQVVLSIIFGALTLNSFLELAPYSRYVMGQNEDKLFALVIIVLGLYFIFKGFKSKKTYTFNYIFNEIENKQKKSTKINGQSLVHRNNFSDSSLILTNQDVKYLFLENQFGMLKLDLVNYTFPQKKLIIDVDNLCGSLKIYLGDNKIEFLEVENFASSINNKSSFEELKQNGVVTITGKNKLGEIEIV